MELKKGDLLVVFSIILVLTLSTFFLQSSGITGYAVFDKSESGFIIPENTINEELGCFIKVLSI
jgi:hypothetical protein